MTNNLGADLSSYSTKAKYKSCAVGRKLESTATLSCDNTYSSGSSSHLVRSGVVNDINLEANIRIKTLDFVSDFGAAMTPFALVLLLPLLPLLPLPLDPNMNVSTIKPSGLFLPS